MPISPPPSDDDDRIEPNAPPPADDKSTAIPLAAEEQPDAEERIPLYDGELSASAIVHEPEPAQESHPVRGRRAAPRKVIENAWVLFAPEEHLGPSDPSECPLVDISTTGFAIYYDRPLKGGVKGHVSYRSVMDIPIRVGFTVQRCQEVGEGIYLLGAKFVRKLRFEESRLAATRPGREVMIGTRARRIKLPVEIAQPYP